MCEFHIKIKFALKNMTLSDRKRTALTRLNHFNNFLFWSLLALVNLSSIQTMLYTLPALAQFN